MSVLYLITGFIFAITVPILEFSQIGTKGFLYFLILIVFLIFMLSYVILSVYKFKIAKFEFLNSKKIVSWNIEDEPLKSKKHYYLSLLTGVVFGALISVKSSNLVYSIMFSLALTFVVLGWCTMGIKRLNDKISSIDNFLISHMGIICKNKAQVFDGYSKGILSIKKENNDLKIVIKKGRKLENITVCIPDDKINEVEAFLNDLKEHLTNNEE